MSKTIYVMTQFSFDLPESKYDEIIDAWCSQEGYSLLEQNQETKLEFAQRTLKEKLLDAYIRNAAELARIAAIETAQNEI